MYISLTCCLHIGYWVLAQESMGEAPFFFLYGRDARIPTETVLSIVCNLYAVDLDLDYKEDLVCDLSAWKLASENIEKTQTAQYDRKTKEVDLHVRE